MKLFEMVCHFLKVYLSYFLLGVGIENLLGSCPYRHKKVIAAEKFHQFQLHFFLMSTDKEYEHIIKITQLFW